MLYNSINILGRLLPNPVIGACTVQQSDWILFKVEKIFDDVQKF